MPLRQSLPVSQQCRNTDSIGVARNITILEILQARQITAGVYLHVGGAVSVSLGDLWSALLQNTLNRQSIATYIAQSILWRDIYVTSR